MIDEFPPTHGVLCVQDILGGAQRTAIRRFRCASIAGEAGIGNSRRLSFGKVAGSVSDTIYAVAAGGVRSALTVFRVSGQGTGLLLDAMASGRPRPRQASLRTLRTADGGAIDRCIVLWFPAPRSYTGEDCAEFHFHGGRAVLEAASDAFLALGARPAEPGEFTRRAFLHGNVVLLAAEAIADLVNAETQAQRLQALDQLGGALGAVYRSWSSRLTRLVARQEASIDFPDEGLPTDAFDRLSEDISALRREIASHLADGRRGEKIRDGLCFAVVGAPNVGKSSLVNALAERDVAIVSAIPGTTRDVLEARVILGDVPVTLLDTAGLRESSDPIEAEGVRRARVRSAAADLTIAVVDAVEPGACPMADLVVANKIDIAPPPPWASCAISVATGSGIGALRRVLDQRARMLISGDGGPPFSRARHRAALQAACVELAEATAAPLAELAGENLRQALRQLGSITGEVDVEDVLDSIFAEFCIGK